MKDNHIQLMSVLITNNVNLLLISSTYGFINLQLFMNGNIRFPTIIDKAMYIIITPTTITPSHSLKNFPK